jgi:hypothetical protein
MIPKKRQPALAALPAMKAVKKQTPMVRVAKRGLCRLKVCSANHQQQAFNKSTIAVSINQPIM